MNIFKIIKYQLHLLQLENYELGRFWKLLFKKGLLPTKHHRQELVWTLKARVFFSFSFLLILGCSCLVIWLIHGEKAFLWYVFVPAFLLLIYAFSLLNFVFLSLAEILLLPIDYFIRALIIFWAKEKLKKLDNVKVIAIAGSYGKTTMKQILAEVLGVKYNLAATPSSINTPIGIARWIINRVDLATQILIVEMGEHYVGDVEYLCKITPPDISVVTGINEAHLERMKTMENVESTIFEVVSCSKAGAQVFLNANNERIVKNYKKYIWPDHKVSFFGGKKETNLQLSIYNYQFNTDKLGWDAEVIFPVIASASEAISGNKEITASPDKAPASRNDNAVDKIFINLLGEYAIGDTDAVIKIAKSLEMNNEEIKKGIARIRPIEHRLQPINSSGNILVIDDSYNGNPSGASEAIRLLEKFPNRRKIYITPGLVEIGEQSKKVHMALGQELAKVADVVILIKNSVTPFIEMGIHSSPSRACLSGRQVQPSFDLAQGALSEVERARDLLSIKNQEIPRSDALSRNGKVEVLWFKSAQKAHAELKNILKPGDVVLFQNDWGDQYL